MVAAWKCQWGQGRRWRSGPEAVQGKLGGVEGRLANGIVVLERGEQGPAPVVQLVHLQRLQVGVHQPEMAYPFAGVDGHLQYPVGAGGGRGEDLAYPVGRKLEPGCIGQLGHAFAPPAGEVRYQDLLAQVELGFVEDPPATRAAAASTIRVPQVTTQSGIRHGMSGCGPGVGMKAAVNDFPHLVFRQGEEVLVGGFSLGGLAHEDLFSTLFISWQQSIVRCRSRICAANRTKTRVVMPYRWREKGGPRAA